MGARKKVLSLAMALVLCVGVITYWLQNINSSAYASTPEEEDLLARLIRAEAGGESLEAQIAVGAVVLNRVKSSQFPNTITEVINQKVGGVYQFTPVKTGAVNKAATETNKQAAKAALDGQDPTNGALFFYDQSATDKFMRSLPVAKQIGALTFSYSKNGAPAQPVQNVAKETTPSAPEKPQTVVDNKAVQEQPEQQVEIKETTPASKPQATQQDTPTKSATNNQQVAVNVPVNTTPEKVAVADVTTATPVTQQTNQVNKNVGYVTDSSTKNQCSTTINVNIQHNYYGKVVPVYQPVPVPVHVPVQVKHQVRYPVPPVMQPVYPRPMPVQAKHYPPGQLKKSSPYSYRGY